MASDLGGSVTLIFYKIGDNVWREPALNVLAAAFQWSSFTHVELAIASPAPRRITGPAACGHVSTRPTASGALALAGKRGWGEWQHQQRRPSLQ